MHLFKGTLINASWSTLEEEGLVIFSFNFPFPLEVFFHLPPLTCVPMALARVSMKDDLMFSSRESLGWGCCFSNSQGTNHIGEDGKHANP